MLLLREPEKCMSPCHQHSVYLIGKIASKQIYGNVIMEELSFWQILVFTLAFALLRSGLKNMVFVSL